jgi:hypothetical protein
MESKVRSALPIAAPVEADNGRECSIALARIQPSSMAKAAPEPKAPRNI